jgi:hypothetical protein
MAYAEKGLVLTRTRTSGLHLKFFQWAKLQNISQRLHPSQRHNRVSRTRLDTEETKGSRSEGALFLQLTPEDKAQELRFSRSVLETPQTWVSLSSAHFQSAAPGPQCCGSRCNSVPRSLTSMLYSSQKEGAAEDDPRGLLD